MNEDFVKNLDKLNLAILDLEGIDFNSILSGLRILQAKNISAESRKAVFQMTRKCSTTLRYLDELRNKRVLIDKVNLEVFEN